MELKSARTRILRMKDLPSKIGLQPSTIYELITKNKFPPPFKIVQGGRASGWYDSTIEEWISLRGNDTQTDNSE